MKMATVKEKDPRQVTLKRVILSFTDSLLEKKKTSDDPNAKPKHGLNIIIPDGEKYSKQNRERCVAAIEAACEKQWKKPKFWKDIKEDNPKRLCYRDGSKFKNKEGQIYQGYDGPGIKAFSASGPSAGQRRPVLRDRHKRRVEEKDILDVCYSGTYADVIVSFFGTDKGSAGVFASCEVIRSWQEGERMAGGYQFDEDDLDEMDDAEDDDDDGLTGGSNADDDDEDLL